MSFVDALTRRGDGPPIAFGDDDGFDYDDPAVVSRLLADVNAALVEHERLVSESVAKFTPPAAVALTLTDDAREGDRLFDVLQKLGADVDPHRALRQRYREAAALELELADVEAQLEAAKREDDFQKRFVQILAAVEARTDLVATLDALNVLLADLRSDAGGDERQDGDLPRQLQQQYAAIKDAAAAIWADEVSVTEDALTINKTPALEQATTVLPALDGLAPLVRAFCGYAEKAFVLPVLCDDRCIAEQSDGLQLGSDGKSGLDAIVMLCSYIADRLPAAATPLVHRYLTPGIARGLVEDYLPRQLPLELQSASRVRSLLAAITDAERALAKIGLLHGAELSEWSARVADVWFEKWRDAALDGLRQSILGWMGETEKVELSEQVTNEEIHEDLPEMHSSTEPKQATKKKDDADGVAWDDGWDVDETEADAPKKTPDEETEAWGWGDEDPASPAKAANSTQAGSKSSGTVTLVDRFTVSTLPNTLIAAVDRLRGDAHALSTRYHDHPVATARTRLPEAIAVCIELYGALIPRLQRSIGYPRMLTYNDCKYLQSRLADTGADVKSTGEHYYMLEIDEKREQLLRIMEKADGFVGCTLATQNEKCKAALQQVIDVLDRLHERWSVQLGRTTLLTALGTLVESCIASMTNDIMAMTDISEAESAELARLGDTLGTVERLFQSPGEEMALAGAWVPSWFKFRYVLDILEANLAYIEKLYREGALADFSRRETTDLIRALFADSEKRKRLIHEVEQS